LEEKLYLKFGNRGRRSILEEPAGGERFDLEERVKLKKYL